MNATFRRSFRLQPHVQVLCGSLALAIVASVCGQVAAQENEGNRERPPMMETRVFSVADLILPAPDYSFRGVDLSVGAGGRGGFGPAAGSAFGGYGGGATGMGGYGGGGLGGGGLGGGGLGGGGGFFQIAGTGMGGPGMGALGGGGLPAQPQPEPATRRFGMENLIQVIYTTVGPGSWDTVGGEGSIAPLGTMLVVRQSRDVLDQVEALLMNIRETGGTLQSVTIRADWLLLESGQLAEITAGEGAAISRAAVQKLAAASGASGQITCFDGQTVHIVAGKLQTGVTSVIPVVGQHTPQPDGVHLPPHVLAQQLAEPDSSLKGATSRMQSAEGGGSAGYPGAMSGSGPGRSVGYQPVMQATNLGVLLQVTATVGPDGKSVVLDLRSLVSRPEDQSGQPVNFHGVVPLDRLNVTVQQFMTTLHLPVGEPKLIAGSTLEPFAQGAEARQLYLVVEATLAPRP